MKLNTNLHAYMLGRLSGQVKTHLSHMQEGSTKFVRYQDVLDEAIISVGEISQELRSRREQQEKLLGALNEEKEHSRTILNEEGKWDPTQIEEYIASRSSLIMQMETDDLTSAVGLFFYALVADYLTKPLRSISELGHQMLFVTDSIWRGDLKNRVQRIRETRSRIDFLFYRAQKELPCLAGFEFEIDKIDREVRDECRGFGLESDYYSWSTKASRLDAWIIRQLLGTDPESKSNEKWLPAAQIAKLFDIHISTVFNNAKKGHYLYRKSTTKNGKKKGMEIDQASFLEWWKIKKAQNDKEPETPSQIAAIEKNKERLLQNKQKMQDP